MLKKAIAKITRRVVRHKMIWPDRSDVPQYIAAGWNHQYESFNGTSWVDVQATLQFERNLLQEHASVESVFDPDEVHGEDDQLDRLEHLRGLDDGVASCVFALSAARCRTISSCNGGVFGDFHPERHPLVIFFAKRQAVPLLFEAAKASGAGLTNYNNGALMVYADDIEKMVKFAEEIYRHRTAFGKLAKSKPRVRKDSNKD